MYRNIHHQIKSLLQGSVTVETSAIQYFIAYCTYSLLEARECFKFTKIITTCTVIEIFILLFFQFRIIIVHKL